MGSMPCHTGVAANSQLRAFQPGSAGGQCVANRVTTLRLVLGDQCSASLSSLADLDPAHDTVLMAEVMDECSYVRHHPKKITLILSAMRHFADSLRRSGVKIRYVVLDDPRNTGSLQGEVRRAAAELHPEQIVVTEPGEWRVLQDMRRWPDVTGIPVDIRDDTRFLCRLREFRAWAQGKQTLRMEFFYREMRRRCGLLMDGDQPAGGRWNYDAENRKRLPAKLAVPEPARFPPDAITDSVTALVRDRFPGHFGTLDGFDLPVTAAEAAEALGDFITHRLPQFGDWQDRDEDGRPGPVPRPASAPP